MKYLEQYGRWLADTHIGQWLSEFFEKELGLMGMAPIWAIVVSSAVSALLMMLFWHWTDSHPHHRISKIDLDDFSLVEKYFGDEEIRYFLICQLQVENAETIEVFEEQLKAYKFFSSSILRRIDIDDDSLMDKLFCNEKLLFALSKHLELPKATSVVFLRIRYGWPRINWEICSFGYLLKH